MKIHPTALVDKSAIIGADVEIGAFSIVGPEVIIGDECVIQSHVVLEGEVRLGVKNVIGHGTIVGGLPQDLSYRPATKSRLEIGDRNVLREHCTIHRGTVEGSATTLGHDNFLMAGSHVGHNCQIGNRVIIANNSLLGGYVRIDDGAFLGGSSIFHQFIRVGRLVIVQGNGGFSKDIPPFTIAGEINFVFGVNLLGLRRAGLNPGERDEIRRAFKLLYRSNLNTQQALEAAAKTEFGPAAREFFAFVLAAKKRGITPYRHAAE